MNGTCDKCYASYGPEGHTCKEILDMECEECKQLILVKSKDICAHDYTVCVECGGKHERA